MVSLAIGFAVTTLYDRKGLHRMHPLTVARMRTFLQQELHHRDPSTPQEPRGTVQSRPATP